MNFDASKLQNWVQSKEYSLPGLQQLFRAGPSSNILIIGASVFELYQVQDWTPALKRQTGDIDLSVGLVSDDSLYTAAKEILISQKYVVDFKHPYRYHPQIKIPGGYTYIDLLAHPASGNTPDIVATDAMKVSSSFSVKAFSYAQKESFTFQNNVSFPNPFGFLALKREAYLNEPNKRSKDFADILELISGLVENGTHFSMTPLWKKVSKENESNQIKEMINEIIKETNPVWDIEDIRSELKSRNFDSDFIDETLLQRVSDFRDILI